MIYMMCRYHGSLRTIRGHFKLTRRRYCLGCGSLLIHRDDLLDALSHPSQFHFGVWNVFNYLLEVCEKLWIAHLFPQRGQERLQLRIDKDVLAVGIVEHITVNGSVVNERTGHVPI